MKAKILIDDAHGRWRAGEEGSVLEICVPSDPYDFLVELPGEDRVPVANEMIYIGRRLYFNHNEVELFELH